MEIQKKSASGRVLTLGNGERKESLIRILLEYISLEGSSLCVSIEIHQVGIQMWYYEVWYWREIRDDGNPYPGWWSCRYEGESVIKYDFFINATISDYGVYRTYWRAQWVVTPDNGAYVA